MTSDDTPTRTNAGEIEHLWGPGQPEIGATLAGRFHLESILGSGATGTVYRAVDATVGERIAIKLLHPGLRDDRTRERLRREVRASRPGHPNIVTIYDLHEAGPHLFLSMELVEGSSLRSVLGQEGELPVDRVVDIGRQSVAALQQLHNKGLVHRDVKPGNILIASDGTVKLCDMGLARPLEEGVTVTETEMVVGTPGYMAPEMATGVELTAASDVYGLGLTLYQALTGEVPLKETTIIATLSRRQRGRPPSVKSRRTDCPRWLDRLILRMLEPDPKQRITAPQALKALENRRLMPRPRRRTIFLAVILAGTVLTAAWAAHNLLQRATTMVDVTTSSITGRDIHGRPTWSREFDLPVYINESADLNGDGNDETIVVLGSNSKVDTRPTDSDGPEIWIFESNGDVIKRFEPEQEIQWQFDYEIQVLCTPHILDLDHDGRSEVLSVCQHVSFFPTVVFLYQSSTNRWKQVLTHPGYILDVRPTPPDRGPGLRFIGVNNRLGVMECIGEITIEQDDGATLNVRAHAEHRGLQAPPYQSTPYSPPFRWSAYIPVPVRNGRVLSVNATVEDLDDGSVRLKTSDGRDLIYDSFWNLTEGPNVGHDLRAERRDFMAQLIQFTPDFQMSKPTSIPDLRSTMKTKYELLLEEAPYRLIFDLKSAHALAQTGHPVSARDLLRRLFQQTGHTDAGYRLAHLEALEGNFNAASDGLMVLMTNGGKTMSGTRAFYDGPHLAIHVGIENHDQILIDKAISILSAHGGTEGTVRIAQTLLARVRLWWDQIQPEDLDVESRDYAPSGDAVACLARWRKNRSRPSDPDLMTRLVGRNPDVVFEGRLARAAALIGTGNAAQALDELNVLIRQMEFPSRDDFSVHQLADLARAIRLVALQADGQNERARAEAAQLKNQLTPGLLPAILVDEVLGG